MHISQNLVVFLLLLVVLCFAGGVIASPVGVTDTQEMLASSNQLAQTNAVVASNAVVSRADPDWIRGTRESGDSVDRGGSPGVNPLRSLLSLAGILAVLIGLHFFIRRKLSFQAGAAVSGDLAIVSRRKLGARQELVAVSFGSKTLLLGVTPDRITCLDQALSAEAVVPQQSVRAASSGGGGHAATI